MVASRHVGQRVVARASRSTGGSKGRKVAGFAVAFVACVTSLGITSVAGAATNVTMTTSASPNVILGGSVYDLAAFTFPAGSPFVTGTVTFNLYGPTTRHAPDP